MNVSADSICIFFSLLSDTQIPELGWRWWNNLIFHIVDVLYVGNTLDADALTINKGLVPKAKELIETGNILDPYLMTSEEFLILVPNCVDW